MMQKCCQANSHVALRLMTFISPEPMPEPDPISLMYHIRASDCFALETDYSRHVVSVTDWREVNLLWYYIKLISSL